MSKLKDFLTKNKIDSRRVLVASKDLEQLRPEDRKVRLAKKVAKAGGDVPDAVKEIAAKERRSGRAVNPATMRAALAGETVSGPAKTRILRALNAVLKLKKKDEVALRDVF